MSNKLIATIENMEVRKVFRYEDTKGWDYLIVTFEDDDCNKFCFIDDDLSRENLYKRGTFGTLMLEISACDEISNDFFDEMDCTVHAMIYDFIPDKGESNV